MFYPEIWTQKVDLRKMNFSHQNFSIENQNSYIPIYVLHGVKNFTSFFLAMMFELSAAVCSVGSHFDFAHFPKCETSMSESEMEKKIDRPPLKRYH